MIEITAKLRKWGHSLGMTLPNKITKKMNLRVDEPIKIIIETPKTARVKDIFGIMKLKKPTQELIKEADRELDIPI